MSIFDSDIFGGDHSDGPDDPYNPDSFEEVVRRILQEQWSPRDFEYETKKERWVVLDGQRVRICPDVTITDRRHTSGTKPVACVADAKLRAVLSKRDAEEVARYGRALNPSDSIPRIYVPEDCHEQRGALALEAAGHVEIIKVKGVLSGTTPCVEPEPL